MEVYQSLFQNQLYRDDYLSIASKQIQQLLIKNVHGRGPLYCHMRLNNPNIIGTIANLSPHGK